MPKTTDELRIDAGDASLEGMFAIPDDARGLVVFVHGSGSSRHSSRNQAVARTLREEHGQATLLFDLLTEAEDRVDQQTRQHRFDIPLLARRVAGTLDWLSEQDAVASLEVGLFGASTGAAAALVAAAQRPDRVGAVVSRGGRSDLAGDHLEAVRAPTLLIVGQRDPQVITLNEQAQQRLAAPHQLQIVPRATHLFEEPGALEQVAQLAGAWFTQHLESPSS